MALNPLVILGKLLWVLGVMLGGTTAAVSATNWLTNGRAQANLLGLAESIRDLIGQLAAHGPASRGLVESSFFSSSMLVSLADTVLMPTVKAILMLQQPLVIAGSVMVSTLCLMLGHKLAAAPRN